MLPGQHRKAGPFRPRLGGAARRRAELELVGEFTEVESGRKTERPELAKALARCKKDKARS